MIKKKKGNSRKKQQKGPQRSLKGKHFWTIIGIVFFLSFITIFSSMNSNNLTGKVAIQMFAFEEDGKEIHFETNEGGIKEATITFSSQVKNGKLLFEPNDLIPFKGAVYSKMKVSAEGIKFSNLNLILKIKEQDLNQLGINRAELSLYINGKKQPTSLIEIKDNYNFYKVNGITELGNFVIGKAKQPEPIVSITTAVEEVESTENVVREDIDEEQIMEEPVKEDQEPLVGKAVQQEEKEGFFSRLWKKLFG